MAQTIETIYSIYVFILTGGKLKQQKGESNEIKIYTIYLSLFSAGDNL